ncbi:MAG: hypothetical protein GX312_00910 [Candidatus Phytoplasma sp.]|nr:hypothetical protein [Phytoplasma sp.]
MNQKRSISKTLAVVAYVVLLLQIIISSMGTQNSGVVDDMSFILILGLGVAFVFANNNVVEKVGYIILSIVAVTGLAAFLVESSSTGFKFGIEDIIGLIIVALLLISSGAYLFKAVLEYYDYNKEGVLSFGKVRNEKLHNLKRWKKLNETHLVSDEVYEQLRKVVLNKETTSAENKKLLEMLELMENQVAYEADLVELLSTL